MPVVKNRTSAHRGWNKCTTRCVPRTITLSGGLNSKLLDVVVVVVDCCLSVVNNTTFYFVPLGSCGAQNTCWREPRMSKFRKAKE